jgi:single-stranded DNA-binding protein
MTIDVAFYAVVGRDPQLKTSKSGRAYLRLNVRAGNGDGAVWLSVMVFNDVEELAGRLTKESKVYIEGAITADAWIDRDGKARANLNVMTWHCVETHRIGRNKPPAKRKAKITSVDIATPSSAAPPSRGGDFYDDSIPFAPEWRG